MSAASYLIMHVTSIALKYNCKIRRISLSERVIELDCPDINEKEASIALSEVLERFGCE